MLQKRLYNGSNRRWPSAPKEDHIVFDILDLSTIDRKILMVTWDNAKSLMMIERETGISKTSLAYALKKLCKRHLLLQEKNSPYGVRGSMWKCDLPRAAWKFELVAWFR